MPFSAGGASRTVTTCLVPVDTDDGYKEDQVPKKTKTDNKKEAAGAFGGVVMEQKDRRRPAAE